MNNPPELPFVN